MDGSLPATFNRVQDDGALERPTFRTCVRGYCDVQGSKFRQKFTRFLNGKSFRETYIEIPIIIWIRVAGSRYLASFGRVAPVPAIFAPTLCDLSHKFSIFLRSLMEENAIASLNVVRTL